MFQTLLDMCSAMGMEEHNENNPFDCGTFFQGDGSTTKGYFWCLSHDRHFTVTKCDFYFYRDTELTMPCNSRYISVRLEYAKHLPPERSRRIWRKREMPSADSCQQAVGLPIRKFSTSPPFTSGIWGRCLQHRTGILLRF